MKKTRKKKAKRRTATKAAAAPPAARYRARWPASAKQKPIDFSARDDECALRYASSLLKHKAGTAPATIERLQAATKANPSPSKVSNAKVAEAVAALEEFSGHPVLYLDAFDLELPAAAWQLGPVAQINYIATRDGQTFEFEHRFKSKSRPHLLASHDGSMLLMLGGAFSVTDRGIVDD